MGSIGAAIEEALKERPELGDEMTRKEQALYTRLMRGDDPTYRLRLAGRAQQALLKIKHRSHAILNPSTSAQGMLREESLR